MRWRVTRQTAGCPRWWLRVRRLYRWGSAALGVGLSLWLLGWLLAQPALPGWAWLCLAALLYTAVGAVRQALLGPCGSVADERAGTPIVQAEAGVSEVTIDLAPILATLGDLSPQDEVSATTREALTAQFERIRAACFRHPAAHALLAQVETQVAQLLTHLLEEALRQELDEYLGFARYERTGVARPACRHRSGVWRRSLRTMWGSIQVRVPKLRQGNRERPWQILTRYERSFGPWLDVQLALYVLGLSQEDTPPVLIVDGVNIKVLCPSGTYRVNQRGQRRQVKRAESRVILAALGVWASRQRHTLYFETVEQETKASWQQFFRHLVARGLDTRQLQLVVGDGRPGLGTAIRSVFPSHVKQQRCIFHKLQNLGDNLAYTDLVLNPDLPYREALRQAKIARARAILQDAANIYAGSDIAAIQQRLL